VSQLIFTEEHQGLMSLIDHLDAAYLLTDYAPIHEYIHMAKVEAERRLGERLLSTAREAL
jgi:hypothetical protein